jgi:hypothetical protein
MENEKSKEISKRAALNALYDARNGQKTLDNEVITGINTLIKDAGLSSQKMNRQVKVLIPHTLPVGVRYQLDEDLKKFDYDGIVNAISNNPDYL